MQKVNATLDASFFPNLLVILPENGAKINVHAVPNKLAIDIAFVFFEVILIQIYVIDCARSIARSNTIAATMIDTSARFPTSPFTRSFAEAFFSTVFVSVTTRSVDHL